MSVVPHRRDPVSAELLAAPGRRSRVPWRAARRGRRPWRCAAGPGPGTSPRRRGGSRGRDGRRRGPPGARRPAARPDRSRVRAGRARRSRRRLAGEGWSSYVGPGDARRRSGSATSEVELGDGGLHEARHRGAAGRGAVPVPLGGGSRAVRAGRAGGPGSRRAAPRCRAGSLGSQRQDGVDRRDEGVADGELDHAAPWRRRPCRCHAADEVERLQLGLVEAVGRASAPRARRRRPACEPGRSVVSTPKSGSRSS